MSKNRGWVLESYPIGDDFDTALKLRDLAVPEPGPNQMHMLDNVFVDPGAYKVFLQTGTWPDKTMLVMELRGASSKGSINKNGHYQSGGVMGVEVHVKDSTRFNGGWAFFAIAGGAPAAPIPASADCYSCHRQHAAVDTTFVQFYPTLIDLATKKGTLSEAYLHDQETGEAKR